MYPSQGGRQSVDVPSPLSPSGRGESPFLRHASMFPRPRRGSAASSVHSIGGHLDTSTSSWSNAVLESGQNAISTLLQPPIVRTGLQPHTSAPASSAHKPPTARDIPPVALTNIPHIDASEFKPYLTQVGALYEQLQRVKDSEEEHRSRPGGKADEVFDPLEDSHKGGSRPTGSRKSSITSISSLASLERPGPARRSGSSYHRKGAQGLPPLSTIPNVYFEEDFHLENPRTFDVVSERSDVVPPSPTKEKPASNGSAPVPRKALATNAILQEKLSWYMDTVEVHLINSISTASTTFFTALGSLRELHSEAADSVERIKTLRKELETLDEEVVAGGLELVQKRQKRENLRQLNDAVLQLKRIVDGVTHCETLVDDDNVEDALAEIDALEKLMAGEQDEAFNSPELANVQLRDMRAAVALQGVNADLDTLRLRIGKVYESKLHTLLLEDLRRHVESVSIQEVLLRWASASIRAKGGHVREPSVFPTYMGMTTELRKALLPNISGLHRAKHISAAIQAYRELVLREIRSIVRRHLPSSSDDDAESAMSASTMSGGRGRSAQEKSSILSRNLRALDAEDSEELLAKVYVGVTETLRRLTTQAKVLLDVASAVGDPDGASGMKSPAVRSPLASPNPAAKQDTSLFQIQEELHGALDLSNLLGQAVDVGQDKMTRVLRVRSEQSTELPLPQFLRYFTLNLFFANECESISGRSGTPLKTVVNGHIQDFVDAHGKDEKQVLAQGMKADNWSAKDFTEKDTELLNRVLESSTRDPAAWTEVSKIWIPLSMAEEGVSGEANGTTDPAADTNGAVKDKVRGATIEEETFLLPHSAILCLEGTTHFLHLMGAIPSMTSDIAISLVAYLQTFNSLCTQLILGAGATLIAGLKNILTKHLALASQAISFFVTLIPHIREFVRRHAPAGAAGANLMGEFDKVRRLFQEHHDSIYQKFVEIMAQRARLLSKKARETDWGAENPDEVRKYMADLVKDTGTLYKVLVKHLPERALVMVMAPVFTSYKDQLGKAYREADAKTERGRDCMLRDIDHLMNKLGKVEGFGDLASYLIKIIESKEIQGAAQPPVPANEDTPTQENKEEANEAEEKESKEGA